MRGVTQAPVKSTFLADLQRRGLLVDATSPDDLDRHLAEPERSPRTIYVGFDPTADSLHVGSLLPLLALRRAQLAGHRPIVLVGGGTGLIGDPSGKAGERALNPKDTVAEWADRLKRQVGPFLDLDGRSSAILLDNYEWLSRLDLITFLRDVGKHFPIGAMMARESVRGRMGRDAGLIETALAGICHTTRVANMPEAVRASARFAQPGDTVLLSPACSSLDMFRDYAERGNVFAAAVLEMKAPGERSREQENRK